MYLHEFLFLMTNSVDRQSVLSKLKTHKVSVSKVDLPTYPGLGKLDGNVNKFYDLDWLYPYQT